MSLNDMSLDDKIALVHDLVRKSELPDLRLFLITPSQWLRVYKGRIDAQEEFLEIAFIKRLKADRGQILDFVVKLEALANELIQAKLLGLLSEKAYDFDDLLQKINFRAKIGLLKKWHVIDRNLNRRINKIQDLRNQFAHSWSEHDIFYEVSEGNLLPISQNIEAFKKDAEEVWVRLIDIYTQEENKNIGILIAKLDDPNTIKVWEDISKEKSTADTQSEVD
jgi:hypothetical protein